MVTNSALIMQVYHLFPCRVISPLRRWCVDLLWIALGGVHATHVQVIHFTHHWHWSWLGYFGDLLLEFFDHCIVVVVVDTLNAGRVLVEWAQSSDEVHVPRWSEDMSQVAFW